MAGFEYILFALSFEMWRRLINCLSFWRDVYIWKKKYLGLEIYLVIRIEILIKIQIFYILWFLKYVRKIQFEMDYIKNIFPIFLFFFSHSRNQKRTFLIMKNAASHKIREGEKNNNILKGIWHLKHSPRFFISFSHSFRENLNKKLFLLVKLQVFLISSARY